MIHDPSLLKLVDGDDGSENRQEGRFSSFKIKVRLQPKFASSSVPSFTLSFHF